MTKSSSAQWVEVPSDWQDDVGDPSAPAAKHDPPAVPHEPADAKLRRTIALGLFGGAAVGVGVGAVFGVMTLSTKGDADSECPNKVCNADGYSKVSTAQTYGLVSTISFIVGAVAGGAGAYLFFSADQDDRHRLIWFSPSVGPRTAGATFGRSF